MLYSSGCYPDVLQETGCSHADATPLLADPIHQQRNFLPANQRALQLRKRHPNTKWLILAGDAQSNDRRANSGPGRRLGSSRTGAVLDFSSDPSTGVSPSNNVAFCFVATAVHVYGKMPRDECMAATNIVVHIDIKLLPNTAIRAAFALGITKIVK